MVPTTLFKSVRSLSHEQSVPTCMNKPVNNHVKAGQLNHVQACQQHYSSWPAQPCFKPVNNTIQAGQLNHVQACQQHYSSWPVQPCFKPVNNTIQAGQFNYVSSLSTGKNKLCVFTSVAQWLEHLSRSPVTRRQQVRFPCSGA